RRSMRTVLALRCYASSHIWLWIMLITLGITVSEAETPVPFASFLLHRCCCPLLFEAETPVPFASPLLLPAVS
ncbi:MAG: hypothetical protein WCS57_06180, partial [Bacillota bacterium]